ncbi:hypothetical protein STAS_29626 [Striga asiatica]|uniref:Uncharacterized protein n=1 Tax=Striga asiatica TaxID=4170 RepID=A0A5A7R3Z6_STRAF|nr:hypothetical protein STAS_29626 [Striga asiatica]
MSVLHFPADATTSVHRRLASGALNSSNPTLLISSSLTSFSTRPSRRKNHLRQKILKTLEKPIIPRLTPPNPITPIFTEKEYDSDKIQLLHESGKSENSETGNEEVRKSEELREIEVSESSSVDVSIPKDLIFKHWHWLVGSFVFQTLCAIWIFSWDDSDGHKKQISSETKSNSVLEVEGNEKGKSRMKSNIYGNGTGKMGAGNSDPDSIVYVDKLEMERKIEEIQVMANKAREVERLELKKNGIYDSDEIDGENCAKNEIQEEVGNRLVKFRKKLEKARSKVPVASVEYLRKENETNDEVKIHDKGVYEGDINGELLFKKKYKFKGGPTKPVEKPKGFVGSVGTDVESLQKPKVKNGIGLEKNNGKKLKSEAVEPRKSTSVQEVESGNNSWWLNLPYVTVIVMGRGQDDESVGFYSLQSISSTGEQLSHLVAFEDHTDATNFSYLLQSFFDYMDDFMADIVPLTVKELNESAKYMNSKVLVVKKQILQLYAGQPLDDAETKLRAMI